MFLSLCLSVATISPVATDLIPFLMLVRETGLPETVETVRTERVEKIETVETVKTGKEETVETVLMTETVEVDTQTAVTRSVGGKAAQTDSIVERRSTHRQ